MRERAYVHACVGVLAFVGKCAFLGMSRMRHACAGLHDACAGAVPSCEALVEPVSLLGDGGWVRRMGETDQQGNACSACGPIHVAANLHRRAPSVSVPFKLNLAVPMV